MISAMSMRRRTATTTRTVSSMTRSLVRSSSVSLVLPLAPHQSKSSLVYTLRRAQSSIPVIVSSEFVSATDNSQNSNLINSHVLKEQVVESGNSNDFVDNGDGDTDSYCSGYTSCSSSPIADLLEVLDEPRRLSKEILRSVSTSYKWLDLPFHEFELPQCKEVTSTNMVPCEEQWDIGSADGVCQSAAEALPFSGLPIGRQGSVRFAYIHDCRTGTSLLTHVELTKAMDNLLHWTMQVPRNCCLSYRHDTSGEVATVPWPDLEAGGMDEMDEFVRTVNRVEGKPVFFPRYQRSPFQLGTSFC